MLPGRPSRPPFSLAFFPSIDVLDVAEDHVVISSTAARSVHREWMAPEAAAFDVESGGWSDPERYARWLQTKTVRP